VTQKKGGSARRALQRGSRRDLAGGETPATVSTGPGSARIGREETKRITVDLPISEHGFLRDFAYDNDTDGMRVVGALLLELGDDPGAIASRARQDGRAMSLLAISQSLRMA
jgi:hypothetical protein